MPKFESKNVFITGGAGFLGSVFVQRLCALSEISKVTVFDRNAHDKKKSRISSTAEIAGQNSNSEKLVLISGDLKDTNALTTAMAGHDTVLHLASNADISRAVSHPAIDFDEGTILTQNALEAARIAGVKRFLYASGSGVYGDAGVCELTEDSLTRPISTYGASKLAGESLLSAYCYMFQMTGIAFRFANIVGPAQTHGVGFDFVQKLKKNPNELQVLGDGSQTKSYIDANDIFDAVWLVNAQSAKDFDLFNVASDDSISVKEIAKIAVEELLGKDAKVQIKYGTDERGWKGDVPVVRLNSDKIRALGFCPKLSSSQAIRLAIRGIIAK